MPRNRKPICFIAMAFGREDTDLFYEKQILPILKKNNVTPVIINRRVSNDDINVQIIEQLERADFCIADLTYTRPSVYFEAGFAQRSIPVIYTVRKDHLLEGQPEDLRVHFDLKMKPIIDWENPSDSTFGNRLERRMKITFLSEWEQQKKKQSKIDKAITNFEIMSLDDRLSTLRRKTIYAMRKANISISNWQVVQIEELAPGSMRGSARSNIIKGFVNCIAAIKIKNKNAQCISIQSYESVYKKDIMDLYSIYFDNFERSIPSILKSKMMFEISSLKSDIIVLSIKSVPADRIEGVLRYSTTIERSKCYFEKSIGHYSKDGRLIGYPSHEVRKKYTRKREENIVEINTRIHFLSGIKSDLHLKQELDKLIEKYLII